MKALKIIGISLVAAIGFLIATVALQPAHYRIERSRTLPGSQEVVFDLVSDFKVWPKWSPWHDLDPSQTLTYSGPARGVGQAYEWAGNDQVGKGKMAVTAESAPTKVVMSLEFVEPFASKATTTFSLAKEGEGTKLTWAMEGENDFPGKAFALFANMDAMIGKDFEKGLGRLEGLVKEESAKVAAAKTEAEKLAAEKAAAEAAAAAAAVPVEGAAPAPVEPAKGG